MTEAELDLLTDPRHADIFECGSEAPAENAEEVPINAGRHDGVGDGVRGFDILARADSEAEGGDGRGVGLEPGEVG